MTANADATTERLLRNLERRAYGPPLLGYHQSKRAWRERRANYLINAAGCAIVAGILGGTGWAVYSHAVAPPPTFRIENCVVISGERALALGDFSEVRTESNRVLFRNLAGSFWPDADWIAIRVPEAKHATVIEAFVKCRKAE